MSHKPPKCHTSRAKMSHKGQNVTQSCYNKGIKNGLHCGDQRHAGLCLGRRPSSRRRVQGRSQGTTLSASDLHNARATILNPFYNMECKTIKKIRQNAT